MQKSKIEWCDYTWNPVTGCLYGCGYCYARRIAERFAAKETPDPDSLFSALYRADGLVELAEPIRNDSGTIQSFPNGFVPTLHSYRFGEPAKLKKPANIFVCSMADLFGDWVPDEWIQAVFQACKAAPWHRYLFLTKNPAGLPLSSYVYSGVFGKHADNFWFGMTVTNKKSLQEGYKHFSNINGNTFLSIEPLHEPINLYRIDTGDVIYNMANGMAYYLGDGRKVQNPKWVILGAETGNRKGKVIPRREWVESIVDQCHAACVPLFLKNNLADIWGEALIQEYPW